MSVLGGLVTYGLWLLSLFFEINSPLLLNLIIYSIIKLGISQTQICPQNRKADPHKYDLLSFDVNNTDIYEIAVPCLLI